MSLTSDALYYAIHDLRSGERRTVRFASSETVSRGGPILGPREAVVPIHPAPPANSLETQTVRFIPYESLPLEPAPE